MSKISKLLEFSRILSEITDRGWVLFFCQSEVLPHVYGSFLERPSTSPICFSFIIFVKHHQRDAKWNDQELNTEAPCGILHINCFSFFAKKMPMSQIAIGFIRTKIFIYIIELSKCLFKNFFFSPVEITTRSSFFCTRHLVLFDVDVVLEMSRIYMHTRIVNLNLVFWIPHYIRARISAPRLIWRFEQSAKTLPVGKIPVSFSAEDVIANKKKEWPSDNKMKKYCDKR